jgi:hypothetical protein
MKKETIKSNIKTCEESINHLRTLPGNNRESINQMQEHLFYLQELLTN